MSVREARGLIPGAGIFQVPPEGASSCCMQPIVTIGVGVQCYQISDCLREAGNTDFFLCAICLKYKNHYMLTQTLKSWDCIYALSFHTFKKMYGSNETYPWPQIMPTVGQSAAFALKPKLCLFQKIILLIKQFVDADLAEIFYFNHI